jgi:cell division protein FtsN
MPRNHSPAATKMLTMLTMLTMLAMLAMFAMVLLVTAGCDNERPPDERFQQLAQQALHEQSEQNKRLVDQNKQVAEASRQLVAEDAQARRELLEAQRQLTSELHAERASLDRQHEALEEERRSLAAQQQREPVIAHTIGAVGLTLACLLPLLLAAYVIHTLNHQDEDPAALNELLVLDLTSERPRLLPHSVRSVAALEHRRPDDDESPAAGE